MEYSKAMNYVIEKAKLLHAVHATSKAPEGLRTAYYYYGLICLAALSEATNLTPEQKEMEDEIRAVKAALQAMSWEKFHKGFSAMGYDNFTTYALAFYNHVMMDYPEAKYDCVYGVLIDAKAMAERTTGILDTYHLLGSILKRDYFFTKLDFTGFFDHYESNRRWNYIFHIYKNKERIGRFAFKCNICDISIGRDESNTIVIRDSSISPYHILIRKIDGIIYLKDVNSSSGVLINGEKLKPDAYTPIPQHYHFKLGTDIEIYTESTLLENPTLKKCTLCRKEFLVDKYNESPFCFTCRKQAAEKTGTIPQQEISYTEKETVDLFYSTLIKMYSLDCITDAVLYGTGKQLLALTKPVRNMAEYLEKIAAQKKVETPPKPQKDIVQTPPVQKKVDTPPVQKKVETPPVQKKETPPDNSLLSRCSFVKEIGKGGMGIVTLIEDKTTHKQYAFKQIKAEKYPPEASKEAIAAHERAMINSFLREANLHMRFDHPYVAKIYEIGVYKNSPYIIMEYYKDGTLTTYYNRIKNDPKKYELVRKVFIQILEGLDYLHHAEVSVTLKDGTTVSAHGIVHRDLKPDNIFMAYDSAGNPVVKIADFGMSKAYEVASETNFTAIGGYGGTLEFMPKQQLTDYKFCKPDVDLWAATASIYALLTSNVPKPFRMGVPRTSTVMYESAIPIRVYNKNVPRKFAKIIDRALVDKELHYKQAKDLIHDLNKFKC